MTSHLKAVLHSNPYIIIICMKSIVTIERSIMHSYLALAMCQTLCLMLSVKSLIHTML